MKSLFLLLPLLALPAMAQRGPRVPMAEKEQQHLDEGFTGVTTGGKAEEGLFEIASTGVSTEPVMKAAEAFLAGLSEEQRKASTFAADDEEWRRWANQHSLVRQGVSFEQMSSEQRKLAFGLMKAGLSAHGLATSAYIMKLNRTLGELSGHLDEYTEHLYHLTVMGEPSETKPWGWQLDGHHLVINYFVLGDQVVMTPHFLGSEPIRAEGGKFAGTEVMQEEEAAGLTFVRTLSEEQMKVARIAGEKGPTNCLSEAFKDNLVLDYAGIKGEALEPAQQKGLLALVRQFLHMADGHAEIKLSEVEKHLDDTHFAWIGGTGDEDVFYFRVHSPVILIEFDHQRPIALGRDGIPTKNHIHAVVRTPNGNDYGKDLLKQHYEKHGH